MSVDEPETDDERKAHILELVIPDLVGEFLYYGRKEDEQLPRGEIERLITEGSLTVEEIVEAFDEALRDSVPCPDHEIEKDEEE